MMALLGAYLVFGIPVFMYLFIRITRMKQDIIFGELLGMCIIACAPIMRELVLLYLLQSYCDIFNKVIFKQHE